MVHLRFELALLLAFILPGVLAHRAAVNIEQDFAHLGGALAHEGLAGLQLREEERAGGASGPYFHSLLKKDARKEGDSVLSGPKRLTDWLWVIVPAALLLFVSVTAAAIIQSRATQQEEEAKRMTQSQLHPLLLKWGAAKSRGELHPESTFVQDLRAAFTVRRLVIFFICLGLCFCIAEFVDERKFAITRTVPSVTTKADCLWHCRHTDPKRALCDDIKFSDKLCASDPKASPCVLKTEDQKAGVDYVLTPKCSFKVVPPGWKVDMVLCSVVMGIFLIVEGVTTELILIGMACVFASVGIITAKQAFSGFASDSVAGLAFLFPVAAAVEETGVLDVLVGLLLGNPTNFFVALFRMMVPVAILSAFLSNTAIVTMLIPIIMSWARRLDASPSKLLMPLSFAAQLGGSCTLIGSSHVLVAKTSVDVAVYDMGFFDLAPSGSVLCLITFCYMALFLPLLSAADAPAEVAREPSAILEGNQKMDAYNVGFQVCKGSSQVGMEREYAKLQLERLPGVKAVEIDGEGKLEEGSVLMCNCTDKGLVALRRVPGLLIGNHADLRKMGMGFDRRHRHLYEVVVNQNGALVGQPMDADAMRQVLGACPVALRGKEPAPSQLPGRETPGATPAAGDVLLLEADARFVGTAEWTQEFSVTRKVDNSSPQRVGGVHDSLRCTLVCLGMAMFCALNAMNVVGVAVGAGIFTTLLVMSNSMTMEEVYSTIKVPVLLTIAGASALSAALQEVGIANFVAGSLTEVALPFGRLGIQLALYLLAAGLSMFMNNSATIAILGPMLGKIVADMGGVVSVKSMLFVCVFGAGTCLTTPLGYQTNMMVMKDGGYTFVSFTKYGTPIQLLHMVTTVGVITLFGY